VKTLAFNLINIFYKNGLKNSSPPKKYENRPTFFLPKNIQKIPKNEKNPAKAKFMGIFVSFGLIYVF
jgi:hypothetical protein